LDSITCSKEHRLPAALHATDVTQLRQSFCPSKVSSPKRFPSICRRLDLASVNYPEQQRIWQGFDVRVELIQRGMEIIADEQS
jgi:hypothetical protein